MKNIFALVYSGPMQHGKDSHVLAAMTTGIKMAQTPPRCETERPRPIETLAIHFNLAKYPSENMGICSLILHQSNTQKRRPLITLLARNKGRFLFSEFILVFHLTTFPA